MFCKTPKTIISRHTKLFFLDIYFYCRGCNKLKEFYQFDNYIFAGISKIQVNILYSYMSYILCIVYIGCCIFYVLYISVNKCFYMWCICSNDLKLRKGNSYNFVNYRIHRISFPQKTSVDSSINQKTLKYLKKVSEMFGIDGKYPASHMKVKLWQFC